MQKLSEDKQATLSKRQEKYLNVLAKGGTWEERNLPPISFTEQQQLESICGAIEFKGSNGICRYWTITDVGLKLINAINEAFWDEAEKSGKVYDDYVGDDKNIKDVADLPVMIVREDVNCSPYIVDRYEDWGAAMDALKELADNFGKSSIANQQDESFELVKFGGYRAYFRVEASNLSPNNDLVKIWGKLTPAQKRELERAWQLYHPANSNNWRTADKRVMPILLRLGAGVVMVLAMLADRDAK